jgi:hypothetical protein
MPLVEAQTAAFRFQKMAKLNIYINVSHMPLVEAQTSAFRFYKQLEKINTTSSP